jgi:hypothetical protein
MIIYNPAPPNIKTDALLENGMGNQFWEKTFEFVWTLVATCIMELFILILISLMLARELKPK